MARVKQVSEHRAEGDVERVYHELRQTMRVSGVDVSLRTWAAYPRFFVAMWEAMGPNVETRAFEELAAGLWQEVLDTTVRWEVLGAWSEVQLGPSQRFHARGALELYEAMQPRVLLMVSAVRLALDGHVVGHRGVPGELERLEHGVPARMAAMEWVAERPRDALTRSLFTDIEKTVGPPGVPGEYRALACWPEYLEAAWRRLKPRMKDEDFQSAVESVRESARRRALSLPYAVALSRERVAALGENVNAIARVTEALETRLPSLLLNLSRLVQDVPDMLRQPMPGASRLVPDWVAAEELR